MKATAALIVPMLACFSIVSAHAGPCTDQIAQFEQAVRESGGKPGAGPYDKQSIGAQMAHQPTPQSVERAEQQAQSGFTAELKRAKDLDAQDNRSGCEQALARAKDMYNLQ